MRLRPYQIQLKQDVYAQWQANPQANVLAVAATGSGKTVVFADVIQEHRGASIAVAHRQELVTQISIALARVGVRHRLIGNARLPKLCVKLHMDELGRSYYDASAACAVAGVDTLVRMSKNDPLFQQVTLGVQDECFVAGTLVDGRPIELLRAGDYVTAFDETTSTFAKKRIVRTMHNQARGRLIFLRVADSIIECTWNHPFYTRRGWVNAQNLKISDWLYNRNREWHIIDNLTRSGANESTTDVYNIEVEDFHTYLVDGFVVHNCHHMLTKNKWGKAAAMFPNARWLGVTATPTRADGHGLGRDAEGVFDVLVQAPGMRDLIRMGYLTDYRIFTPPSDLDLTAVPLAAGGDFSPEPLRKAVHKSHIVGDVIAHYKRLAPDKLGVTFAVDVEAATELAAAYRAAGVTAEVVSANTPPAIRAMILRRFANRQIMQLVNVDLFGEGFDLPAIECVSFARPTQSFGLFCQQFGRSLRLMLPPDLIGMWDTFSDDERRAYIAMSTKPTALIIDHVGNVHRHGLPDSRRTWTLDSRDRRSRGNVEGVIPIRTCSQCGSAYEATRSACPYCGFVQPPAGRSTPIQVDGDLYELLPEALARLRGEIDAPMRIPYGAAPEVVGAIVRRYRERQAAQEALRGAMMRWGGARTYGAQESIGEAQRRFYYLYGIDVASAQALPRAEADALREKIERDLV